MKAIAQYLDSTFLKLPEQARISPEEIQKIVYELTDEAIENEIFAVMIRPNFVKEIKSYIEGKKSTVKVGTVIGFHEGTASVDTKLSEAQKAIRDGADELDFVINYALYIEKGWDSVKNEVYQGTKLCLDHEKIVKWIIETAALTKEQIADLTSNIAKLIQENFEGKEKSVFVKSSTGFFKTPNGEPKGATIEGIKIMLENAGKLPVKAAGGVRNITEAKAMIDLGVTRIGTSSALEILRGEEASEEY